MLRGWIRVYIGEFVTVIVRVGIMTTTDIIDILFALVASIGGNVLASEKKRKKGKPFHVMFLMDER